MGEAYFYHLTQNPLERSLPALLRRALGAGWRCQVVGGDAALRTRLDTLLWTQDEGGFLPHGIEGGPHDAEQPVLFCVEPVASHQAQCLMFIAGAPTSPDVVQAAERACILFDGHDPDAVQTARDQWRSLTQSGCGAQYWSEESGRWELKAKKEMS